MYFILPNHYFLKLYFLWNLKMNPLNTISFDTLINRGHPDNKRKKTTFLKIYAVEKKKNFRN